MDYKLPSDEHAVSSTCGRPYLLIAVVDRHDALELELRVSLSGQKCLLVRKLANHLWAHGPGARAAPLAAAVRLQLLLQRRNFALQVGNCVRAIDRSGNRARTNEAASELRPTRDHRPALFITVNALGRAVRVRLLRQLAAQRPQPLHEAVRLGLVALLVLDSLALLNLERVKVGRRRANLRPARRSRKTRAVRRVRLQPGSVLARQGIGATDLLARRHPRVLH